MHPVFQLYIIYVGTAVQSKTFQSQKLKKKLEF